MSERLNGWDPDLDPVGEPKVDEDDLDVPGQPRVRHRGDSVTTGTMPPEEDTAPQRRARPVRAPVGRWLAITAVIWLVVGALAGVVWEAVVPLSTYRVNDEGYAATTERGLAAFIAGDAWFVLIGAALGLLSGILCWWWFAGLGWPVVPLAIAGALIMAVLCWQVGSHLGPGPLQPRVAAAQPGQVLPIQLTLRGWAALLVWPFASVFSIMLISAFARDPEESVR